MFCAKISQYIFIRSSNSFKFATNRIKNTHFQNYQYISSAHLPKSHTNSNRASNPKHVADKPNQPIKSNETEKQFLVRIQNDPDLFGDPPEEEIMDEGDLQEDQHYEDQPLPSQKLRTKQYADMIKALIRKRKIKEAIDVVEERMIKVDRVQPENYIFNLLLGACGRVGYTKKAFSLYNKMKQRGLKVTGGTYTALFNACANSPWPEDGLTRANHLRNIMIEQMYEPNDTNYNAMIKAFGRCGDLSMAFQIADEMASKRFIIKDDTINFLLQACIDDKDAGFRHALLVWRKLLKRRIPPTIYTFNLMLRTIRDCGIGDVEVTKDVLSKILTTSSVKQIESNIKLVPPSEISQSLLEANSSMAVSEENELVEIADKYVPNLMARVPHLGNLVSLSEINKPEDRLLLVGGMSGFLANMEEHKCIPDIKTFTQLLDCLPGSLTIEKRLLKAMDKHNVQPDADFYNMLIKKRSMRFDYEGAKSVVQEMKLARVWPNIMTYGVLSLGCKSKDEANDLLQQMKQYGYQVNVEILGAMLQQACYHNNFAYVLEVMQICLREDVKPSKKFLEHLATFKKKCKQISNDKEHKFFSKRFQRGFTIFLMRYKTWLEDVKVDDAEEAHPWTQFRQETNTDVSQYKDTETRFKPRHTSLFKVKTSTKERKRK